MYTTRRNGFLLVTGLIAVIAVGPGCQGGPSRRIAASEPGLSGVMEPGATLAEAPPPAPAQVGWVDRHPLFSKPRDMYESTNSNKAVKSVAAAVVGVPVGLVGEIKQIVVGRPTAPPSY